MRTFVAIEISDNNVINSIEKFQKELKINAKPVNSRNLHFTLQFLGEITEEISQKIIQILKTINFSSFDVNLKGIGVFPKLKFPRIVWIGTDENGGNKLVNLAQKIEELLKPLGFSSHPTGRSAGGIRGARHVGVPPGRLGGPCPRCAVDFPGGKGGRITRISGTMTTVRENHGGRSLEEGS